MNKENLFQAVRSGDVVLWVGAGFSLYAGYPTGAQLVKNVHSKLSKEEQELISPELPLPLFAEKCINIRGGNKNNFLKIVVNELKIKAKSLKYHEKLSKVSFIDTIVTTNYDDLFEKAYGENSINKVVNSLDLPFIDNSKTTLYKIHGELSSPASIVISDGDFRKFYLKKDLLLWSVLESMMATKTLIFLGYSLEDPNVLSMFEYVLSALPEVMRDAYFVAPDINKVKERELLSKNINYINSTGEQFIEELMAYFKDNLLRDVNSGVASGDKAKNMLQNLGLNLYGHINGRGFEIQGLCKLDGTYNYALNFKMKDDSEYIDKLLKLKKGEIVDTIAIPYSAFLQFDFRVEGFKIPIDTECLYISNAPVFDKLVDFIFEDGFHVQDVKLKVFGVKKKVKIIAAFKHVEIAFEINDVTESGSHVKFEIVHEQGKFKSVHVDKGIYEILKKLGSGVGFNVFYQDASVYMNNIESVDLVKYAENMIKYFNDLAVIERHFSVLFRNMTVEDSCYSDVELLANVINNSAINVRFDEPYIIDKDKNNAAHLNNEVKKGKEEYLITSKARYNVKFTIYDMNFVVEFSKTYLIIDGFIEEVKIKGKSCYLMGSKSKKAQLNYEYPATDNAPFNIAV